jgi:hypothetical protein
MWYICTTMRSLAILSLLFNLGPSTRSSHRAGLRR